MPVKRDNKASNKPAADQPPTADKVVVVDELKDASLRRKLTAMCIEWREAAEQEAEARKRKAALKLQIDDAGERLIKLGVKQVKGDGWTFSKRKGAKKLSKELLLLNGVGMDVIEESMVEGEGGWQVRGVKDSGASDGEE